MLLLVVVVLLLGLASADLSSDCTSWLPSPGNNFTVVVPSNTQVEYGPSCVLRGARVTLLCGAFSSVVLRGWDQQGGSVVVAGGSADEAPGNVSITVIDSNIQTDVGPAVSVVLTPAMLTKKVLLRNITLMAVNSNLRSLNSTALSIAAVEQFAGGVFDWRNLNQVTVQADGLLIAVVNSVIISRCSTTAAASAAGVVLARSYHAGSENVVLSNVAILIVDSRVEASVDLDLGVAQSAVTAVATVGGVVIGGASVNSLGSQSTVTNVSLVINSSVVTCQVAVNSSVTFSALSVGGVAAAQTSLPTTADTSITSLVASNVVFGVLSSTVTTLVAVESTGHVAVAVAGLAASRIAQLMLELSAFVINGSSIGITLMAESPDDFHFSAVAVAGLGFSDAVTAPVSVSNDVVLVTSGTRLSVQILVTAPHTTAIQSGLACSGLALGDGYPSDIMGIRVGVNVTMMLSSSLVNVNVTVSNVTTGTVDVSISLAGVSVVQGKYLYLGDVRPLALWLVASTTTVDLSVVLSGSTSSAVAVAGFATGDNNGNTAEIHFQQHPVFAAQRCNVTVRIAAVVVIDATASKSSVAVAGASVVGISGGMVVNGGTTYALYASTVNVVATCDGTRSASASTSCVAAVAGVSIATASSATLTTSLIIIDVRNSVVDVAVNSSASEGSSDAVAVVGGGAWNVLTSAAFSMTQPSIFVANSDLHAAAFGEVHGNPLQTTTVGVAALVHGRGADFNFNAPTTFVVASGNYTAAAECLSLDLSGCVAVSGVATLYSWSTGGAPGQVTYFGDVAVLSQASGPAAGTTRAFASCNYSLSSATNRNACLWTASLPASSALVASQQLLAL